MAKNQGGEGQGSTGNTQQRQDAEAAGRERVRNRNRSRRGGSSKKATGQTEQPGTQPSQPSTPRKSFRERFTDAVLQHLDQDAAKGNWTDEELDAAYDYTLLYLLSDDAQDDTWPGLTERAVEAANWRFAVSCVAMRAHDGSFPGQFDDWFPAEFDKAQKFWEERKQRNTARANRPQDTEEQPKQPKAPQQRRPQAAKPNPAVQFLDKLVKEVDQLAKRFKWSQTTRALASAYIVSLVGGDGSVPEALTGKVLDQVRAKFACTCAFRRVPLWTYPGQHQEWFLPELRKAEAFVATVVKDYQPVTAELDELEAEQPEDTGTVSIIVADDGTATLEVRQQPPVDLDQALAAV